MKNEKKASIKELKTDIGLFLNRQCEISDFLSKGVTNSQLSVYTDAYKVYEEKILVNRAKIALIEKG